MTELSRRKFFKIMAYLFSHAAIIFPINIYGKILPRIEKSKNVDFTQFHELSRLITNTNDLDEETSGKIFNLLINEPSGEDHLKGVYNSVRYAILVNKNNKIKLSDTDFTRSEEWFISHLLMTWYTGVYYHEMGNRHITLKNSLMYKKIASLRFPPTYCGRYPGFWKYSPFQKHE